MRTFIQLGGKAGSLRSETTYRVQLPAHRGRASPQKDVQKSKKMKDVRRAGMDSMPTKLRLYPQTMHMQASSERAVPPLITNSSWHGSNIKSHPLPAEPPGFVRHRDNYSDHHLASQRPETLVRPRVYKFDVRELVEIDLKSPPSLLG